MYGIYHSRDLDGWVSAAILKQEYPDIKLIGWDYGDAIPDPEQFRDHEVIMTDIGFPIENMEKLAVVADVVTWIDHHKSSINEFNNAIKQPHSPIHDIHAIHSTEYAACELTYLFCNSNPLNTDMDIPEPIRLLGMYDSFRHKGTPEEKAVMWFQYYARSIASNPEEAKVFLDPSFDTVGACWHGDFIYKYLMVEARQEYDKAFETVIDGYKMKVVNRARFNPANFEIDYHADGYDIFGCFWLALLDKWMWSLYNDNGKVDVSEICKKRGGGGHKGAAGFVCGTNDLWNILTHS